jgi:MFS family permease
VHAAICDNESRCVLTKNSANDSWLPTHEERMSGARALSALGYPAFKRFLLARFLATLAVQMQSVAIGWQVYALTRNPVDLALIGLAQFLPFLAAWLPAGHIVDRHDRRMILALCYATELLCALLLLAFTMAGMSVVWPVFAVLVLFGTARAFSMPASAAITPNLVPLESFGNAVALNSSSWQVATIAGPTLGGVLYLAGPHTVSRAWPACWSWRSR